MQMLMTEVMTNKAPFVEKYNFDGAVTIAVVVRNERPRRPSSEREGEIAVDDWFWRLLNQCWERNPEDRLRIDQLVQQLEIMLD